MKILFFGDITGKVGRKALKKILPELKREFDPDVVLVNAENAAHGNGLTLKTLDEILDTGVDLATSGNHIWDRREVETILSQKDVKVLRPINYPPSLPGKGYKILEVGTNKLFVINLIGRAFMKEDFDCPFRAMDKILKDNKKSDFAGIIVDFHAETTSEKRAMSWYLDGRVSALVGTHTHIGTADAEVMEKGTAYVTDIGMVGPYDSVIGIKKDAIIEKFLTQRPVSFQVPENGLATINSVLIEIDTKTGKATHIERVDRQVEV